MSLPLPVVVQRMKAEKCAGYCGVFFSEAVGSSQFEATDLCRSDQYECSSDLTFLRTRGKWKQRSNMRRFRMIVVTLLIRMSSYIIC